MKMILLPVLGLLAAAPAPALADAVAPQPALRGAPLLTLQAPDRVQLTFRLGAPLPTRFDGEVRGSARISARTATLFPIGASCYAARVPPGPLRVGRTYGVRLLLGTAEPVELRLELGRAQRGDGRGARLGC